MNRVALVDSDIVAYRAAVLTENDSEEAAIQLCRDIHQTWMDAARCDSMVPCLTIGKSYRCNSWPDYKANRKDKPKPKHLAAVRDSFSSIALCHSGWEADDVIGYLHTMTWHDCETVIVTVDKDLDQIPGWHCNPDKETVYEVSPDNSALYRWMQVLSGDTTDNYAGIPKIGEKKAHKLLEDVQLSDYESTVRAIYLEKGLDETYLQSMIACATILTYNKDIECELLSPDSTVESTLVPFLRSLPQLQSLPEAAGT